jgi:serine/threonine protein kinase
VWALGVLLYTVGLSLCVLAVSLSVSCLMPFCLQILYGENPFSGSEHAILGVPKKQPAIQSSPESEHLLEALLRKDWRQRPTADQIMQHPWLRDAEPDQGPASG